MQLFSDPTQAVTPWPLVVWKGQPTCQISIVGRDPALVLTELASVFRRWKVVPGRVPQSLEVRTKAPTSLLVVQSVVGGESFTRVILGLQVWLADAETTVVQLQPRDQALGYSRAMTRELSAYVQHLREHGGQVQVSDWHHVPGSPWQPW